MLVTIRDAHAEPRTAEGVCDEILHKTDRTLVSRLRLPNGGESFICKEHLGPNADERLRHELGILKRLAGVEGTPRLAPIVIKTSNAICMEDTGARSLSDMVSGEPLAAPELAAFALDLARIVAAVHQAGVIHKDINPSNILYSVSNKRLVLIDYDLAVAQSDAFPSFVNQREIAGTLAYLAPEQTGRTGRSVDQRTDLYSLGATLYELATGRPPFERSDPLEVLHDHLARVPVAPESLNPDLPGCFSQIVMHLLEKEPDKRYQSANGLVGDLLRLHKMQLQRNYESFPLGERDFPSRLSPRGRLIGREVELTALRSAFDSTLQSRHRGIIVTGAPGVGKTSLIRELQPTVTALQGWFVAGQFDQYRNDVTGDAVHRALRALGRQLLTEPQTKLAVIRISILDALGSNAGLVAAVLPEFALLLGIPPEILETGDQSKTAERFLQSGLELLRAIASPARPLVVFIDNLQWATPLSIGFIDRVFMGADFRGLMLVCAWRNGDVDATHPLSAVLSRWDRLGLMPPLLHLENLPQRETAVLLEEMLRLEPRKADSLAQAVGTHTAGNPYDTIEMVNGLRRDGVLVFGEEGWTWDPVTVRRYLGDGDVVHLLQTRVTKLAPDALELLGTLACLGSEVTREVLEAGTGLSSRGVDDRLATAIEDGLIEMDESFVRFRHDRVRQVVLRLLEPTHWRTRHLALARRLAQIPALAIEAAVQYVPAIDDINCPEERRRSAVLFRDAAVRTRLLNTPASERFLSAGLSLFAGGAMVDAALLNSFENERHSALYDLGRLDEADAVYRSIECRCADPLELTGPTCVQIASLTNRGRPSDAVALGVALLRRLGMEVPDGQNEKAGMDRRLDLFFEWLKRDTSAEDCLRPEAMDPHGLESAKVIMRIIPAAFFCGQATLIWAVTESQRLWEKYGPCAALVGPLSHAAFITIASRKDYRTAYAFLKRLLSVSEARGYAVETAQARFLFTLSASHWFEPLEDSIGEARRAREGLVRAGDLQNAGFTWYSSIPAILDCASTFGECEVEAEEALTFAERTGNSHTAAAFAAYRQLGRLLRGELGAAATFPGASLVDGASFAGSLEANPTAAATLHLMSAHVSVLFGNVPELIKHAAAGFALLPYIESTSATATAHLLQSLALAERAKSAGADTRAAIIRELDGLLEWLVLRAADAPVNFLHLVEFIKAERAWAIGDFAGAVSAFDAALQEVERRQRPWHRALITERAGLFFLAHKLKRMGHFFLADARRLYENWGAIAKVRELDREHASLRPGSEFGDITGRCGSTSSVSSDSIDLLAILRASQALSSETTLEGLRIRVTELLETMSGATAVSIAFWNDEFHQWRLLPPQKQGTIAEPLPIDEAVSRGMLPLSAFSFVERSREALVVEDAKHDDRFSQDPYFANFEHCSLLAVPILSQGVHRAILLLENQLSRGAFSADRLDVVTLIAGQLAVSLDNALLYASLERKVAERTEALKETNRQLEILSITDPLTGLANRRRFQDALSAEWARGQLRQTPIGAAMIDIDNFKLYNDRYGHLAGDACLQRVARALQESISQCLGIVTRYGGEEFAFILSDANYEVANAVAERARAAVEALKEPHADSPGGIVTISIGIASTVPSTSENVDTFLEHADGALYEAKRQGRNRVFQAD